MAEFHPASTGKLVLAPSGNSNNQQQHCYGLFTQSVNCGVHCCKTCIDNQSNLRLKAIRSDQTWAKSLP